MPGCPFKAIARASKNSVLRPPRPVPRNVTVVSPPEMSTQGAGRGWAKPCTCRAMAACTKPTSRASPSIALARIIGSMPALRATWAAASSGNGGVDQAYVARLAVIRWGENHRFYARAAGHGGRGLERQLRGCHHDVRDV